MSTTLTILETAVILTVATASPDAQALRGIELDATTVGSPSDLDVIAYHAASGKYRAIDIDVVVQEAVDDRVAALIQDSATGGLTWVYDDGAGTLTPSLQIINADVAVGAAIVASKVAAGTFGAGTYSFAGSTISALDALTVTNNATVGGTLGVTGALTALGGVDGVLGGVTPAAATVTTLNATGGGALTGTWSDLGVVTTVDINGGTIGGVTLDGTISGTPTWASDQAITLSTAAQPNVTSLGTLSALQVDNLLLDGNTLSSTAGVDLLITPLDGQQIVLDGTIVIDAGVVTGATSITSTAFVGALTGNASTSTLASTVTVVDTEAASTYVGLFSSATGSLAALTDEQLTYAADTGILTAVRFAGDLTGDVTGNVSGLAGTATLAATVTVVDSTDASSFIAMFDSATGSLPVKTDGSLTYNATTGALAATSFVGPLTGNADTATLATTVTVADESSDTTCFVAFFTAASGSLPAKTGTNLTFDSSTGILTASGFAGPLTGAVTGNADTSTLAATVTVIDSTDATSFLAMFDSATGSLAIKTDGGITYNATTANLAATTFTGALSGTATTATALETGRNIGGVSFDGTAAIVPQTIQVVDSTDASSSIAMFDSATGDLQPKTDGGLTYNATTGVLTATGFAGPLTGEVTGNASTATSAATATLASTVTVVDTEDVSTFVGLFGDATGSLACLTDEQLTYVANTGILTATGFAGDLTGDVTGNVTGSSGSTTGLAATATALATARAINGVDFDGTQAITITAAAGTLTGTTLKSTVITSSLTSVGTLGDLTVTNPIAGDITGDAGGNAATATLAATVTVIDGTSATSFIAMFDSATGALAVKTDGGITYDATSANLATTTFTGALVGNADTATLAADATTLETPRDINGVAFDGSQAITITAAAGTLTGTTLNGTVTGSSLTSVGTLGNLTVTNPITGSVSGASGSSPAGSLTGNTLASGVTASSLTSLGTIGSLVATTADINGGTIDGTNIGVSAQGSLSATTGTFSGNVQGANLTLIGARLEEYATDSDSAAISINFSGYAGGETRFRDFVVYDGKNTALLSIDGSAGTAIFSTSVTGAAASFTTGVFSGNLNVGSGKFLVTASTGAITGSTVGDVTFMDFPTLTCVNTAGLNFRSGTLVTGALAHFRDFSTDASARSTVLMVVDESAAVGATVLHVRHDAGVNGRALWVELGNTSLGGILTVSDETDTSGIGTGALRVAGGGDFAKALLVGGLLTTVATATGSAGLNVPHGTAPSSPVNGDIWTTTAGLYVHINGSTIGPLIAA